MRVVAAHVVSGDKNDILLLDSVSLDDTPFELPPEREVASENYLPSFVSTMNSTGVVWPSTLWVLNLFLLNIAELEAASKTRKLGIEGR